MGNFLRVQCHPNVDSPSEPGFKSIVSDSLEEHCTADEFYDGLLEVMRAPVMPADTYFLKELMCNNTGPDEFEVKVVMNGQKLKQFGLKEDSEDWIRTHQKVVGVRKEHLVISTSMDKDGKTITTGTCRLLKDPLRLEGCIIVDGERRAGKTMAWMATNFYLHPVLNLVSKRKVKVHAGHESKLGGGGPSVITDAMDEYVNFDMAFESFLETFKEGNQYVKPTVNESDGGFEVIYPEPEEMKKLNTARGAGLESRDTTLQVRHNLAEGEILCVGSVGQELLYTSFVYFLRDPLRIESWQVADGKRLGGQQEKAALQFFVDRIISNAEGGQGWYF